MDDAPAQRFANNIPDSVLQQLIAAYLKICAKSDLAPAISQACVRGQTSGYYIE
jgi:hypothetical protein